VRTFLTGLLLSLVCVFVGMAGSVQAFTVPNYDGLVNDYANILSPELETRLETQLGEMALATGGAEIAVVTIPTLEGDTVENVAQTFFDTWQIGKENKDNGLLLLVALEDKKMRIHTGYGTETVITDSTSGAIIREKLAPAFKEGNYDQGVEAAVSTIAGYLADPNSISSFESGSSSGNDSWVIWLVVLFNVGIIFGISLFSYGVAFMGRSKAWWPGGVLGFILGTVVGSWPTGVFFGAVGLFLDYILSKNFQTWKLEEKTTSWRSTYGGFSSSSGSSSSRSSGSSFSSFGGGSSGGGGASGGW
jgi:uncharacterized protein